MSKCVALNFCSASIWIFNKGDWKNHYSEEDSNELDSILEKHLKYEHKFNYGS